MVAGGGEQGLTREVRGYDDVAALEIPGVDIHSMAIPKPPTKNVKFQFPSEGKTVRPVKLQTLTRKEVGTQAPDPDQHDDVLPMPDERVLATFLRNVSYDVLDALGKNTVGHSASVRHAFSQYEPKWEIDDQEDGSVDISCVRRFVWESAIATSQPPASWGVRYESYFI